MFTRRQILKAAAGGSATALMPALQAAPNQGSDPEPPILVVVELSGGNDGLNCVVPYGDDAYYRHRPTIGIRPEALLRLDEHYGLNPGMVGFERLWQDDLLAIVHGCGYDQPSYSHFSSMAYWHTAAPNQGDRYGWLGRAADAMADSRRDDMLVNVSSAQSLAVNSRIHTPVVFRDPNRFQSHRWMGKVAATVTNMQTGNPARDFLRAVDVSARASSGRVRQAWRNYKSSIDYGISPMELPKVAACIEAGMPTQLYYVSFGNNAFDTHVNQPALHRRLLSYACDGVHAFIRDLERMGQSKRVLVLVFSEFGRRVPENANLGTDHGTANVMFMAGTPVTGGHYGIQPSLTTLVDGGNLQHTVDFRQVYATALQDWLGIRADQVLNKTFEPLPILR